MVFEAVMLVPYGLGVLSSCARHIGLGLLEKPCDIDGTHTHTHTYRQQTDKQTQTDAPTQRQTETHTPRTNEDKKPSAFLAYSKFTVSQNLWFIDVT